MYLNIPNAKSADLLLNRDKKALETVIEYFNKTECRSFYVSWLDDSDIDEKKDDERTRDAMKKLLNKGYDVISTDGNTVEFQIWTVGIAYSIAGTDEPRIACCSKIGSVVKRTMVLF